MRFALTVFVLCANVLQYWSVAAVRDDVEDVTKQKAAVHQPETSIDALLEDDDGHNEHTMRRRDVENDSGHNEHIMLVRNKTWMQAKHKVYNSEEQQGIVQYQTEDEFDTELDVDANESTVVDPHLQRMLKAAWWSKCSVLLLVATCLATMMYLLCVPRTTNEAPQNGDASQKTQAANSTAMTCERGSESLNDATLFVGMAPQGGSVGDGALPAFQHVGRTDEHQQNDDDDCSGADKKKRCEASHSIVLVENSDDEGHKANRKESRDALNADAIAVPQDEDQFVQLLQSAGVDTSKWGKSIPRMLNMLSSGDSLLTYTQTGQSKKLVRRSRLLLVRIAAPFPTGLRILKFIRGGDGGTTKYKNCAKLIGIRETDVKDEFVKLLLNKLSLPTAWQQAYLQVVHTRTTMLNSRGGERGTSFPGLASIYLTEEMWVKLEDNNAEDVAGKLPFGQGAFQITGADGETRWWEWAEATEFERGTFERAPAWKEDVRLPARTKTCYPIRSTMQPKVSRQTSAAVAG